MMTYEDGFDLLKKAFAKTSGYLKDSYLFLFIAHAYYEGWLEDGNERMAGFRPISPLENLKTFINSERSESVAFLRPSLESICGSFKKNEFEFTALYDLLSAIQLLWFDQFWGKGFDAMISLINQSSEKSLSIHTQPDEMETLMLFLASIFESGSEDWSRSLFDPFAGLGGLLPFVGESYAQEVDERIYALSRLRTLAQGYPPAASNNMVCADSTKNWPKDAYCERDFNQIVTFPPLNTRVLFNPEMNFHWPKKRISLEEFILCKGRSRLKPGGVLVSVVSNSTLLAGNETMMMREDFIRSECVEAVIQLPSGLLNETDIPISVVVLRKAYTCNSVLFVDASSYFIKGQRRKELDLSAITKIFVEYHQDRSLASEYEKVARVVSVGEVMENKYILLPSYYTGSRFTDVVPQKSGFSAIPLGELVSLVKLKQSYLSPCRQIRKKDLHKKDGLGFTDFKEVEPVEPGAKALILDESAIIVHNTRNLKPTLYRHRDNSAGIALSKDLVAIKPVPSVDFFYLASELRQSYVSEQFDILCSGSVSPHLTTDGLMQIQISMPDDRKIQRSLYEKAVSQLEAQEKQAKDIKRYLDAEKQKMEQLISIQRHRINPYLSGLKDNVSLLQDVMSFGDGVYSSTDLGRGYTVQAALNNMQDSLVQIKALFDAISVSADLGEPELISLVHYLVDYKFTHTMPDRQFDVVPSIPEGANSFPRVVFNRENLTEILDEIIHNAEKHFTPGTPNGKVLLIPRWDGKDFRLLICNNGEPLPPDFDEQRSFVIGYTRDKNGTGKGLFRVRQVCDGFEARVEWENDPNSLYPTGICIIFKTEEN